MYSGEFETPEQLYEIVVKQEKGNIVYLKDIAEIEFDYKEKENYARLRKNPVVMVDIVKRSGENLLIATEKINQILDKAQQEVFPEELGVSITNDQSQFTRDLVSSLENNIISGVILVVLVLLFFLGTRNALFVGIAIPLSMFMAFLILGAFGCDDQYDGALLPHSGARYAGGQRHRGGRKCVPPDGRRDERLRSHQKGCG